MRADWTPRAPFPSGGRSRHGKDLGGRYRGACRVSVMKTTGTPSTETLESQRPAARTGLWPYVQIARVDHWFKNAFMVLGVVLAFFYQPELLAWASAVAAGVALLATCLVASSNYVLNELLDGPTDQLHPEKRLRPVPPGRCARRSPTPNGSLLAGRLRPGLVDQPRTSACRRSGSGSWACSTTCRPSGPRNGRTSTCSASRSTTRSGCFSAGSR